MTFNDVKNFTFSSSILIRYPNWILQHFIEHLLFLDESGHEPQLRAVHADGATAKEAKMGGEARPSGSGVGLMHRLRYCFFGMIMREPTNILE